MSERKRYERWIADTPPEGREGIPAATVILLRESPGAAGSASRSDDFEVLMLRRNSKLAFVGGHWVFPGGRVDAEDECGDELATARRAACREAREEAGLAIDEADLVAFSHWTPPPMTPKRFLTWFFVAHAPAGAVTIDDGEIKDHRWIGPREAMARRQAGEIEVAPPTWITLEQLARHATPDDVLDAFRRDEPTRFATRIAMTDDGPFALYDGDAGYASGDASTAGPRHRLEMRDDGWVYRRDDWPR